MAFIQSGVVMLLLLATVLPGIKFYKKNEFNEKYLSLNGTLPLRGLMAVLIVLHHLAAYYTQISFLTPFQHIGYIIVAMFFFLSGYGLFYGVKNKNNYMHHFLLKRLPSIIIPYYIITCLYAIVFLITKYDFNVTDFFTSFVGVNYIVPGSWYIVMQFLMYVIFYASFKLLQNKEYKHKIILFFVLFVVVFVVFYAFVKDELYTRSIFAFPLGMLYCNYKKRVEEIIKKHWFITAMLTTVLQIATFGIKFMGEYISNDFISYIGSILSSSVFPIFVLIYLNKIKIGNSVLAFFGDISLEIYLIHNVVLMTLSRYMSISNILIFVIAAFVITISAAYLLHLIDVKLIEFFKKLIKA